MAKSRASFLKRQREIAQKEQRRAKLQRKLDRRAGIAPSSAAGESLEAPAPPEPEPSIAES